MVSENLKEWIKEKRKDGVSDERIKQSLEKTGHDPSVVDKLDNPFQKDGSDVEPSEDLFSSSDQGSDSDSEPEESGVSEESSQDKTQDKAESRGSSQESSSFGDAEDSLSVSKESSSQESDSGNSSFTLPSLPSFGLPSTPSVSRKKAGIVFGLILILAGGAAVYSFIPSDIDTDFNPSLALNSDVDSSTDMSKLEQLDSKHSGCPNSGVRIQSVSGSEDVTTADVLVTRNEAWVVLEITKNGERVGFSTQKFKGESQMKVDAVGDQAELRPLGCDDFYSRRSY